MTKIDSKIPEGPVAEKWTNYKAHQKLVNPANKRRLDIIVVGTGLAGASAAASLGEMGFRVFNFSHTEPGSVKLFYKKLRADFNAEVDNVFKKLEELSK